MENNTNNNELAIATDMDLDDSMPLMSPNMPLTTIPEFEEEEENDVCPESTLKTFSQERKRSIVMITRTEESAESCSKQCFEQGQDSDACMQSNDIDSKCTAETTMSTAAATNSTKSTPGSGRSNRLSINLSFLSPSSPSSVSCTSFSSISSASSTSSSPPSACYSSSSSAMSSPGGAISPILNPFQWTSDLRQYIMTDIGPQPSNSQVPALRSHLHLVRQRSYSKIGGTGFGGAGLGGGLHSPSSNGGISPLSPSSSMAKGFGMSISLSPTMTRRTSLQAQALVGQYGNGNAMMLMANGNTGSNDTSSNSHGSSLYGGVSTASLYQQRAGSSSMTDLATIPHDKAFERDLMALHHQHQQHPAAAWDL